MRKFYSTIAIFSLFLTACGSNPQSYLPAKSSPIVNIESAIVNQVQVSAATDSLSVSNNTANPLNLAYKLFWYDQNGVTQSFEGQYEDSSWLNLWLAPQQTQKVSLRKPTEESRNYRFYLRGNR